MQETNNQTTKGFFKPLSEINFLFLSYYILAFVVLFFKIFTLKTDNLTGSTYRIGLFEFAQGFGWFYYLANIIGLATLFVRMFNFLENLAPKIISVVNLIISSMLLFKTIPDAIRPTGSIVTIIGKGELAIGFWLILGLHLLAIIIFYFSLIKRMFTKPQEETIVEEYPEEIQ